MENYIPYIAFEDAQARHEREKVRWFIIVLVLIILLFVSNAAWIAYESQFEDIVVSQDVETGEGRSIITGVGDIYGESEADG